MLTGRDRSLVFVLYHQDKALCHYLSNRLARGCTDHSHVSFKRNEPRSGRHFYFVPNVFQGIAILPNIECSCAGQPAEDEQNDTQIKDTFLYHPPIKIKATGLLAHSV